MIHACAMRHLKISGAVLTVMAFVVLNFGIQGSIYDGKISIRFPTGGDLARKLGSMKGGSAFTRNVCVLGEFEAAQAGVFMSTFSCRTICPAEYKCNPVTRASTVAMVNQEILDPILAEKAKLKCSDDQRIAGASASVVEGQIDDKDLVDWVVDHWVEHRNKYIFTVIVTCKKDAESAKR